MELALAKAEQERVDALAEQEAELQRLFIEQRRGWHSLRRKFATDMRTKLPLRDLCDAGGWKDAQTILKCYQQPDEDLIRGALDARGQPNIAANRQDNRQEGLIYGKQEPRPVT